MTSVTSPASLTYYPYNTAPMTSTHSVNSYHAPYTFPPLHPRTTPQQTVCEVIFFKSVSIIGFSRAYFLPFHENFTYAYESH